MEHPRWDAPVVDRTEFRPALDIPPPDRQNRLTVLLRLLLLIPQFVVLWLLSIVAFVVVVIGWFGALVTGRLPRFAAEWLAGYVAYDTRVYASMLLVVDRYPPFRFAAPDHPVRIELRPGGPLNRLAVFFRLLLVIPAAIVQGLLQAGWWTLSFVNWLIVLILGRMPQALFEATAAVLRYRMRFQAYLLMLTSAYPKDVFGDPPNAEPQRSATRPLVLTGAAKALLVIYLVLGLFSSAAGSTSDQWTDENGDTYTGDVISTLAPLRSGS
ncbi:DUF4389 domain-containing protein [Kitasatospora cheerisanensis]|uniref:Membrane protein n=1 Tax=Kitasatospora cheerisanensis KCTC 2395 TaxID=1348663 RepID=A0A066Z2Y6_9ACTN|nr:DUF4389 domain-containing protein [Kitasatospora cheerisanensis]KDN84545.1 membrane protein [Kitasatospora cheerisanensis KCTC 2395]